MIECKYRIPLKSQDNAVIEAGMEKVFDTEEIPALFVGKSRQNWQNGMCKLLTRSEGQPMACLQPDHNEKTCPDIESLRG